MYTLFLVAIGSATIGIFSSWLVDSMLDHRITFFGSFAGLELSHNPGIAFGLRGHFHKPISFGLAAANITVIHDDHGSHFTEGREFSSQLFCGNVKRQIAYVDVHINYPSWEGQSPGPTLASCV